MGYFSLAEWQKGLADIQCDTVAKLQMKLEYLNNLLTDPNIFKNVFRYAYDFARVSNTVHPSTMLQNGEKAPTISSIYHFV